MRFFRDEVGRLGARCRPSSLHRGLGRIVNGGLVATFAEETAAAEAGSYADGGIVVTSLTARYERPAYIDQEMTAVVVSSSMDGQDVSVNVDVMSGGERAVALQARFRLISAERLTQIAGIDIAHAPACLVAGRQIARDE